VSGLLQDAPLAAVTTPVLDLVGAVPVLGDVVEDSGARELAETVVGVVDDTASDAGAVLDHVVPPVAGALDPTAPGSGDSGDSLGPTTPGTPGSDIGDGPGVPDDTDLADVAGNVAVSAGAPGAIGTTAFGALTRGGFATHAGPTGAVQSSDTSGSSPPAHAPPAPGSSSSVHSGGSSFHDGARLHAASSGASAFAERTPPPSGDDLPDAPVADTDVSPD